MRVLSLGLACAALVAAAPSTEPTFYKDVLPVLQKNCQACHRPGEAGPMSFMSYESTKPWGKAIKAAVLQKKMPPWFADPHYGKFANDRTMAESDIHTLVAWVDAGAKAGNVKDAPKPAEFAEGWQIGKPDMVFEVPTAFNVPASGTIDYQYVRLPTNFTEDKYVQMAEAVPSDREHVHHIIAFIRDPHSPWMKDAPIGVPFVPERPKQEQGQRQGEGGGGGSIAAGDMLAGYAPGTVPDEFKPGQVKLIPKGADIIFQLHYTANGKTGSDKSRVGVIFAKTEPKERVFSLAVTTANFAIPPGDPNYKVEAKLTLQDDSTLEMLLPHMHLRGKDMEVRATFPDGRKEVLLSVPHYSFSWQLSYYLAEPMKLPAGTILEATAHFDNSPNNPDNPDPKKEVHFGEQSWDEMMFAFFDVAVPLNKNPMDLMRPKKKAPTTGAAEVIHQ
ncbi:MAG: thiol-disulfide isomerase [Acidobacteriia bacterium]|nr:thiol-disulfide isomerase [Terriglobia bacterium]